VTSRGPSGSRIFVVKSGETPALLAIVEQIGGAGDAVAAGRVFVDGRRCLDETVRLLPGQSVELRAARPDAPKPRIVDRFSGIVVVDKPAGISTEPDRRGGVSLIGALAAELGLPIERLHACSRLDLPVSGIVLVALDAEARRRVALARTRGELRRRYVALSERAPSPDQGTWSTPIEGRAARTRYAVIEKARSEARCPALLALEPVTGRTHQLRLHAAGAGAAFLGDRARGAATRLVLPNGAVEGLSRVYLHAAWVRLSDSTGGGHRHFSSPIPDELCSLYAKLGGPASAWERALDDSLLATE